MFIHDYHWLAARIAGGCAGLSYLLYIYQIVFGSVRPQRSTWLIWSVISILLLKGLLASGEREMIWIPWSYAIGSSMIFAISLWRGVGFWTTPDDESEKLKPWEIWLDIICIVLVGSSLVVWKILGTPQIPIFINLFADLVGFIPTFKKSVKNPLSERNVGWICFTAGNFVNFFSVTSWHWLEPKTIYMIYMFCGCLMATVLVYRPIQMKRGF